MDLSRVIAVANGKGGVGKTSLVANLAGEFARAGMKTLVVDLDVSGNLKVDLGTVDHPGDDAGRGIYEAIAGGAPLQVVRGVREGIDWIPGGPGLNWLLPLSFNIGPQLPAGSVEAGWREALGALVDAEGYDMVLLDTAPGNRQLQEMALAAAKWILVPLRTDSASWEGLRMLGPLVKTVRDKVNPDLEWLGMVLFGHQSTATRVRQNVLDNLDTTTLPLMEASIRSSESTAQASRLKGLLVYELAARSSTDNTERLKALRARRTDPSVKIPETVSPTSTSLAEDYAALAQEMAQRILTAEAAA